MTQRDGTKLVPTHEVQMTGNSRGAEGRRQISYGYCTCGMGTTNSVNRDSVLRKLAAHAQGDDRGMVKENHG